GGVAAYQGAFIFFQLPHGLFAVSLMTTITPELATRVVRADMSGYRARFTGGLRLLVLVILPAAAGYLVLARPLVGGLLQRIALATGVMAAAVAAVRLVLDQTGFGPQLLAGVVVGVAVYAATVLALRVEEVHEIRSLVAGFVRR